MFKTKKLMLVNFHLFNFEPEFNSLDKNKNAANRINIGNLNKHKRDYTTKARWALFFKSFRKVKSLSKLFKIKTLIKINFFSSEITGVVSPLLRSPLLGY